MASVRYRNKKTDDVVTYAQPIPLLERSDNYVRLEDDQPNKSSNKDAWVEYATKLGIDVDGMNKDEIIATVDGLNDESA